MIIRSALKGILPIYGAYGGPRLISSTSTPLLKDDDPVRNALREKEQSSSKDNAQFALVQDIANQSTGHTRKPTARQEAVTNLKQLYRTKDLARYQGRKWKEGDIYSPHDLSPEETQKWKESQPAKEDMFDVLGINPLHEYKVSITFWIKFFFGVGLVMAKMGPYGYRH